MVGLPGKALTFMKLRIRDNSLRFRLTRSEVETLRDDGLINATLNFPGGAMIHYIVQGSASVVEPTADFADNNIRIRIPEPAVRAWADSEQVSITAEESLDGGASLALLLEKDFACLAPREGEDESDMFPHPSEGQETC